MLLGNHFLLPQFNALCVGAIPLIIHCKHGSLKPASSSIPQKKAFQQTLRDSMKDNILSVNSPSLFFFFSFEAINHWQHDSASKWVMKSKATRGVVYQGLCKLQSITLYRVRRYTAVERIHL